MKTMKSKNNDILEVSVEGRLDASTSEEFIANVEKQLDEKISSIAIDCEKLEYISFKNVDSKVAEINKGIAR